MSCCFAVNPNIKLVTFPTRILVDTSFGITCPPGYVWDFLSDTVGVYNLCPHESLIKRTLKSDPPCICTGLSGSLRASRCSWQRLRLPGPYESLNRTFPPLWA